MHAAPHDSSGRRPARPPASATDRAAVAFASLAGIGFIPGAPATYASFVVSVLLFAWGAPPSGGRLAIVGLLVAFFSLAGVWAAGRAERIHGHDPHCVVIDEVAGMLIAAALVPWDLIHLGAAFAAFRAADILKPPPVYQIQSLPAGWGIVADDLAAGVYTLAGLLLAGAILPWF